MKTPTCKALKRLHNLDDSSLENQHLPKDVVIDLIPASNYAWLRVQCVANNPTLTVKCSPQKRLTSLIAFLEQRWNADARRNYVCSLYTGKSMEESFENQNSNTVTESNEILSTGKVGSSENRPKLRLRPHSTLTKNMNSIRLVRVPNPQASLQTNLSLNAYLSRATSQSSAHCSEGKKKRNFNHTSSSNCSKKNVREDYEPKAVDEKCSNVRKKTEEQQLNENLTDVFPKLNLLTDNTEKSSIYPIIETVRSLNVLNNIFSLSEKESAQSKVDATNSCSLSSLTNKKQEFKCLSNAVEPPPNVTVGEWLSGNFRKKEIEENNIENEDDGLREQKQPESNSKTELPKKNKCTNLNNSGSPVTASLDELYRTLDPDVIRNGWTLENTEELTIGELCFIFKSKGKLVLQYDWDCSTQIVSPKNVLNRLISAASIALQQLDKEKDDVMSNSSPIKNCRNVSSTGNNRKNKRLRTLDFDTNSPDELKTVQFGSSIEKDSSHIGSNDPRPVDLFAIPAPPTSRQPAKQTKNRIVDEALLQEAKGQLNAKLTTRRLVRKPLMMKPQQFHLS